MNPPVPETSPSPTLTPSPNNSMSLVESGGFFIASQFCWDAGYFFLWRLFPLAMFVLHVLLFGLVFLIGQLSRETNTRPQPLRSQPIGACSGPQILDHGDR